MYAKLQHWNKYFHFHPHDHSKTKTNFSRLDDGVSCLTHRIVNMRFKKRRDSSLGFKRKYQRVTRFKLNEEQSTNQQNPTNVDNINANPGLNADHVVNVDSAEADDANARRQVIVNYTHQNEDSESARTSELRFRMAVFYVYMDVLNAPDECEWKGRGGTVATIANILRFPIQEHQKAHRVLSQAALSGKSGLMYDGERQDRLDTKMKMLGDDSFEMQIIADAMEGGFGLRHTQELVNEHRRDNHLTVVGLTTIWTAYLRLDPVITPIRKRKQGTTEVDSPWAKARLEFVTQILVRFGLLTAAEVTDCSGKIPDRFNIDKLTPMSINQLAFWDETHKKVRVGKVGANGVKYQVRFKRTPQGKVDSNNGTCLAIEGTQLNMKYSEEVRLCLGVAKIKAPDGTERGIRLPLFDYSGKVVLTIKDFDKKLREEQDRVRKLVGNGPWVINNRLPDQLWEVEPLSILSGIGPKTSENLREKGICNIGDLKRCNNAQLLLLKKVGIGFKKLSALALKVAHALPGEIPDNIVVDHRSNPAEPNPYKSRFGDKWMDEIKTSAFLSKFVCITDLVTHVYEKTKECFKDTEYKNDFFFYHDALSLMTANDTMEWMREKDIVKHWFLPMLDSNAGTCYAGRPVGNSPEMMPLDASLNKDVDDAVHSHIVFKNVLDADDPRKFSMSTPSRGSFAYRRVWNCPAIPGFDNSGVDNLTVDNSGAPSSNRICQDIDKFTTSCRSIYENKGTVVPGLGTRNGHRNATVGRVTVQNGGARVKKIDEVSSRFIHPDARLSRQHLLQDSKRRHLGEEGASGLDLRVIGGTEDEDEYDELEDGDALHEMEEDVEFEEGLFENDEGENDENEVKI